MILSRMASKRPAFDGHTLGHFCQFQVTAALLATSGTPSQLSLKSRKPQERMLNSQKVDRSLFQCYLRCRRVTYGLPSLWY
mmetsp:Transcript_45957/g.82754  ORF Transcript_45957/g.82754 Transcript_45957/m.82754 type:complete len:81 (-) Transcript_45957:465-707(-)